MSFANNSSKNEKNNNNKKRSEKQKRTKWENELNYLKLSNKTCRLAVWRTQSRKHSRTFSFACFSRLTPHIKDFLANQWTLPTDQHGVKYTLTINSLFVKHQTSRGQLRNHGMGFLYKNACYSTPSTLLNLPWFWFLYTVERCKMMVTDIVYMVMNKVWMSSVIRATTMYSTLLDEVAAIRPKPNIRLHLTFLQLVHELRTDSLRFIDFQEVGGNTWNTSIHWIASLV